jgi:hypothetical protein
VALIVSLRGDLHRFSGKADMKVTTLHPATVTDVWRKRICFNGPLPPDESVARHGIRHPQEAPTAGPCFGAGRLRFHRRSVALEPRLSRHQRSGNVSTAGSAGLRSSASGAKPALAFRLPTSADRGTRRFGN